MGVLHMFTHVCYTCIIYICTYGVWGWCPASSTVSFRLHSLRHSLASPVGKVASGILSVPLAWWDCRHCHFWPSSMWVLGIETLVHILHKKHFTCSQRYHPQSNDLFFPKLNYYYLWRMISTEKWRDMWSRLKMGCCHDGLSPQGPLHCNCS